MTDIYILLGQWFAFLPLDNPEMFGKAVIWATPTYLIAWRLIFDGFDDFLESLRYLFQPDWLSALRGEWTEDGWQSMKFLLWVLLSLAFATGIYKLMK